MRFGRVIYVCMCLAACVRRDGESAPPPWTPSVPATAAIVARVGGVPISIEDIKAEMALGHATRQAALDRLIEFHLLAEKARALGMWKASLMSQVPRELLAQRLLEREFEPAAALNDIPEADLRAIYERSKDQFVHPRLVEVMMLVIYTGPRMKPAPRALASQTAADLERELAALPVKNADQFWKTATLPQWASRKVLAVRTWQGPDKPFPPAAGAAVIQMKRVGDSTPMVSDENGHYIAAYIGEQPAKNVPFALAAGTVREPYFPHWQRQRFLDFSRRLMAGHKIEVY